MKQSPSPYPSACPPPPSPWAPWCPSGLQDTLHCIWDKTILIWCNILKQCIFKSLVDWIQTFSSKLLDASCVGTGESFLSLSKLMDYYWKLWELRDLRYIYVIKLQWNCNSNDCNFQNIWTVGSTDLFIISYLGTGVGLPPPSRIKTDLDMWS